MGQADCDVCDRQFGEGAQESTQALPSLFLSAGEWPTLDAVGHGVIGEIGRSLYRGDALAGTAARASAGGESHAALDDPLLA